MKYQLELDELIIRPINKLFRLHMEMDSIFNIIFDSAQYANSMNLQIYKIRIEQDCKTFLNNESID